VTEKTGVLIVEDHRVLADGLELMLGREEDIEVVGIATNAAEGIRLAMQHRPGVVLMDYHLPDASGAEATRKILERVRGTSVVMLTAETGDEALVECIAAGASGYLPKVLASGQIVDAVRRAAAGEAVLPAGMLARAVEHTRRSSDRRAHAVRLAGQLTPRERDVLALLGKGLDNREISERLGIGYSTVRTHVQGLIEKLGARSRLEAVAKASEAGLLER
jgi:DNA-binding NarL/FixJ family response regulator